MTHGKWPQRAQFPHASNRTRIRGKRAATHNWAKTKTKKKQEKKTRKHRRTQRAQRGFDVPHAHPHADPCRVGDLRCTSAYALGLEEPTLVISCTSISASLPFSHTLHISIFHACALLAHIKRLPSCSTPQCWPGAPPRVPRRWSTNHFISRARAHKLHSIAELGAHKLVLLYGPDSHVRPRVRAARQCISLSRGCSGSRGNGRGGEG